MRGRVEPFERRAVDDDRHLVGRDPEPHQPVPHRLVDGEHVRRERDRQPLLEEQQPMAERVRRPREAAAEELRHRLVEVEQDRDADEAQRQGREHEEVGQRVDLDERESVAAMELDRCPSGSDQERRGTRAGTSRGPRPGGAARRAAGRARRPGPPRRQLRAAQPEDHGPAGRRDERFGLAPDARVLLVVGVDDHQDRPRGPVRERGQGRADQPAPRRSTWRGRVACPAELSTVSTTSSARS